MPALVRFLIVAGVSLIATWPAGAGELALQAKAKCGEHCLAFAQPGPLANLRELLTSPGLVPPEIDSGTAASLKTFYAARDYQPLWMGPEGFNLAGTALWNQLHAAAAAGAPGAAPLLQAAQDLIGEGGDPAAGLELLLSAALMNVAVDAFDPAQSSGQTEVLRQAAESPQILLTLQERLPADPAFWRLRTAIWQYRAIESAGGWPALPPGSKLDVGSSDARVATLRQRLRVTGDLGDPGPAPDEFDIALHAAVSRFQARHGLEVDGIVGGNTLAALNLPVSERLAAMNLNLRRLLQERRQWGPRYLAVNAAASSYRLVDDVQKVFERVAIVGQRDWATPEIDSVIDRLEFNPYWTVPPRIAKLELLPKIQRDPDYLRANDMEWVDGKIRQNPGAKNPLGKVKFLFPNPYSVYLHDTNNAGNFERWNRYLSHGCIRVSGALDLAAYLLRDDPQWPPARLAEVLQSGKATRVRLTAPIPVHIVYDTAWVDDDGVVQFRPDIYGRDETVTVTTDGQLLTKK